MANHLEHLTEFKELLKEYKPSPESLALVEDSTLVLLAAPTSVGRNTIISEVLKSDNYSYLVSDTTREPRTNNGIKETNGTEYWFRPEDEVLADVRAGKFLEAAVIHEQQVSGINIRELEKAHARGKIAITDVEVQGIDTIVAAKPNTIAIFVLPPSFEEWQQRLAGRGEMDPAEVKRRMASAIKEFAAALECPYYKFIINDTIPHAAEQVHNLALGGAVDPRQQAALRDLAEQLYTQTVAYTERL